MPEKTKNIDEMTVAEKAEYIFNTLSAIDLSDKIKEREGTKGKILSYLPWAAAWSAIMEHFPDATYETKEQVMDDYGNTRFWHEDGKTGWVVVTVTILGITREVRLAIMDFKNAAIPADSITSASANKAWQRCFVKACAMHGLCIHLYLGEDVPEAIAKLETLKAEVKELVMKKVKQSEKAKAQVAELCKKAEREANPELESELITGNYNNIDDADILEALKKNLMAVRK